MFFIVRSSVLCASLYTLIIAQILSNVNTLSKNIIINFALMRIFPCGRFFLLA
nr:MAG TPA: hypothetical protein [Caudoviricetes sp.]